jgi:hypothetical protein
MNQQAKQNNSSLIHAEVGLPGVGHHRFAVQRSSYLTLRSPQYGMKISAAEVIRIPAQLVAELCGDSRDWWMPRSGCTHPIRADRRRDLKADSLSTAPAVLIHLMG